MILVNKKFCPENSLSPVNISCQIYLPFNWALSYSGTHKGSLDEMEASPDK